MSSHTAGGRTRHAIRGSVRTLFGFEAMVAVLAAGGGLLLIIKPDGSLMDADLTALAGSPFHDWHLPGVLLMTLVGGGFTVAAIAEWAGWRIAPAVSIAAGLGLVACELFEVSWLGFQGLELLFALVGATVAVLATEQAMSPRKR
jgi:hypothetical protein